MDNAFLVKLPSLYQLFGCLIGISNMCSLPYSCQVRFWYQTNNNFTSGQWRRLFWLCIFFSKGHTEL